MLSGALVHLYLRQLLSTQRGKEEKKTLQRPTLRAQGGKGGKMSYFDTPKPEALWGIS